MEQLINKIAVLILPHNFVQVMGYCFWYWMVFGIIILWVLKKK